MLMWLVLAAFITAYIKLEAAGLYRRKQYKELLISGFLWLVVIAYAFAYQAGTWSLPDPARVFDWLASLVKPII